MTINIYLDKGERLTNLTLANALLELCSDKANDLDPVKITYAMLVEKGETNGICYIK